MLVRAVRTGVSSSSEISGKLLVTLSPSCRRLILSSTEKNASEPESELFSCFGGIERNRAYPTYRPIMRSG